MNGENTKVRIHEVLVAGLTNHEGLPPGHYRVNSTGKPAYDLAIHGFVKDEIIEIIQPKDDKGNYILCLTDRGRHLAGASSSFVSDS